MRLRVPNDTMKGKTFSSLRIRNYQLFFIGQIISLCGTWMQSIAQSTYVLYRLHGSGTQLGVLTGCAFAPMLTMGLWAGAVVDRCNKRRVLLSAQALMGVTALGQAIVVATGNASFTVLCAIALLFGIGSAFDLPARQSFVSEMVGPENLPNAVALNTAIFNSGRVVGQAIAGVLVSVVGYAWCFGINAFSFAAIIGGVLLMRTAELRVSVPVKRGRGQVAEGLRYVRGSATLRTVLGLMFLIGMFSMNFQVFIPVLAKDVFHGRESKVALYQVVLGIGCLTGSMLGARRAAPSGRILVRAAFGLSAGLFGLAASPWELLTFVILLMTGVAYITFLVTANATLQLSSDTQQRGRVMALYGLLFAGSTALGGPLVGWLSDEFGARQSIAFGGFTAAVAAVAGVEGLRRGRLHPGTPTPIAVSGSAPTAGVVQRATVSGTATAPDGVG